jgi:hypothetical protein
MTQDTLGAAFSATAQSQKFPKQPHRISSESSPDKRYSGFFYSVGKEQSDILRRLKPCARELYHWLLINAPAGQPQEVYLSDFVEAAQNRSCDRPYNLDYVRRCLNQLLTTNLIEPLYQYSGFVFKLIAHNVHTWTAANADNNLEFSIEKSKTQPSNPDSAVPIDLKEFKENSVLGKQGGLGTIDLPTGVDVGSGYRSEPEPTTFIPPSHGITPTTIQTIETTLNGPISPQLKNILFTCTADRIRNALSALQEQLTKGTAIRNPTGWFINALRRGYTANQAKRNARQARQTAQTPQTTLQAPSAPQKLVIPPDLSAWLNLARQLHIAQASEIIDGQLMIHTPTGPIAWAEISQIWSLDRLRGLITAKFTPALPVQPIALPIVGANFDYTDPDLRSSALGRLQMKFKNVVTRDAAIAECDRWGFEIGPDGPQEVDF